MDTLIVTLVAVAIAAIAIGVCPLRSGWGAASEPRPLIRRSSTSSRPSRLHLPADRRSFSSASARRPPPLPHWSMPCLQSSVSLRTDPHCVSDDDRGHDLAGSVQVAADPEGPAPHGQDARSSSVSTRRRWLRCRWRPSRRSSTVLARPAGHQWAPARPGRGGVRAGSRRRRHGDARPHYDRGVSTRTTQVPGWRSPRLRMQVLAGTGVLALVAVY